MRFLIIWYYSKMMQQSNIYYRQPRGVLTIIHLYVEQTLLPSITIRCTLRKNRVSGICGHSQIRTDLTAQTTDLLDPLETDSIGSIRSVGWVHVIHTDLATVCHEKIFRNIIENYSIKSHC